MGNLNIALWGPEDIAADSDALAHTLLRASQPILIKAAYMSAEAATDAADTNYNTYDIKNGSTVVGTLANGPDPEGTDIPIGTSMAAFTLTAANCFLAAGEVLSLEPTKTGSGLAVPGARIQIEYEFVQPAT